MEKMSVTRRPKWQYMQQAQPTPRILQLPRRPRKKVAKSNLPGKPRERTGKLEMLFDQEREFSRGFSVPVMMVNGGGESQERRGRVEEIRESSNGVGDVEEEKWRFQAEMLRAECNLLRIEREVAVKKMERRRVQVERLLRSAVQSLVSVSFSPSISPFCILLFFIMYVKWGIRVCLVDKKTAKMKGMGCNPSLFISAY